jgi:hypothetical protein
MKREQLLALDTLLSSYKDNLHAMTSKAMAKIEYAKVAVLYELFELATDEQCEGFLNLYKDGVTDKNIMTALALCERTVTDMHKRPLTYMVINGVHHKLVHA